MTLCNLWISSLSWGDPGMEESNWSCSAVTLPMSCRLSCSNCSPLSKWSFATFNCKGKQGHTITQPDVKLNNSCQKAMDSNGLAPWRRWKPQQDPINLCSMLQFHKPSSCLMWKGQRSSDEMEQLWGNNWFILFFHAWSHCSCTRKEVMGEIAVASFVEMRTIKAYKLCQTNAQHMKHRHSLLRRSWLLHNMFFSLKNYRRIGFTPVDKLQCLFFSPVLTPWSTLVHF